MRQKLHRGNSQTERGARKRKMRPPRDFEYAFSFLEYRLSTKFLLQKTGRAEIREARELGISVVHVQMPSPGCLGQKVSQQRVWAGP